MSHVHSEGTDGFATHSGTHLNSQWLYTKIQGSISAYAYVAVTSMQSVQTQNYFYGTWLRRVPA